MKPHPSSRVFLRLFTMMLLVGVVSLSASSASGETVRASGETSGNASVDNPDYRVSLDYRASGETSGNASVDNPDYRGSASGNVSPQVCTESDVGVFCSSK